MFPPELQDMILEFLFQSGMKIILLHTGLRIGEALALEWCDLDFKHEKLRVYKTLNRVTKYYDLKGNELPERYSTIYTFKKISRPDFYNIFRKKLSSIISSNRMQADCWDC